DRDNPSHGAGEPYLTRKLERAQPGAPRAKKEWKNLTACTAKYYLDLHVAVDEKTDILRGETNMGRNDDDQRIYRTFEEFEREELRRDFSGGSVDEILDEMFAGELDFDPGAVRRSVRDDDEEE